MTEDHKLPSLISDFLTEHRVSDGGWAPVTQKDFAQLSRIITELIEAKWGPDPDGDRPVEFTLVDRTRYERLPYLPIKYVRNVHSAKELMRVLFDQFTNLSIAWRGADITLRTLADVVLKLEEIDE